MKKLSATSFTPWCFARCLARGYRNEAALKRHLTLNLYGDCSGVWPDIAVLRISGMVKGSKAIAVVINLLFSILAVVIIPANICLAFVVPFYWVVAASKTAHLESRRLIVLAVAPWRAPQLLAISGSDEKEALVIKLRSPWMPLSLVSLRAVVLLPAVVILVYFFLLARLESAKGKMNTLLQSIWIIPNVLVAMVISNGERRIITDSHYNLEAFLGSVLAPEFEVVQHGFIDNGISFPERFGRITTLYLRDSVYLTAFEKYFSVSAVSYFQWPAKVNRKKKINVIVLSSGPFFEEELRFVKELTRQANLSVAIRLHPNHSYTRAQIDAFGDAIWSESWFPDLDFAVSFNSFMNHDFLDAGVKALFLKDYDSPESAAAYIAGVVPNLN